VPSASAPAPATASASASASDPKPEARSPEPHSGPLGHFLDALRDLEKGRRTDHVRIMWLGDSHAQADFWTGGLRTALQARFGDAGPGFIHLGMSKYRHGDVELELKGDWRTRPKAPSSVATWADGAYGLGGILNGGYAGTRLAGITIKDDALAGKKKLRWDVCVKLNTDRDLFILEVGGGERHVIGAPAAIATAQKRRPDGGPYEPHDKLNELFHMPLITSMATQLAVHIEDGVPDFCGVTVETDPADGAGVIVDNLGINGARYATALAWNADAWIAEVQRRPPELFVLEYGGNEASDATPQPDQYEKNATELIARTKRAAPNASCLVVGPSDRVDAESRIPVIVEAVERAAAAGGCMFWNTYRVMGGKGSLKKWREEKKAAVDGVHLMPKGYAEVAALLTQDILAQY
jgi:lysophospholipase L1-like esterase